MSAMLTRVEALTQMEEQLTVPAPVVRADVDARPPERAVTGNRDHGPRCFHLRRLAK